VIVGKGLSGCYVADHLRTSSPEHLTYSVLAASRAADLFELPQSAAHCVTTLLHWLWSSKQEVRNKKNNHELNLEKMAKCTATHLELLAHGLLQALPMPALCSSAAGGFVCAGWQCKAGRCLHCLLVWPRRRRRGCISRASLHGARRPVRQQAPGCCGAGN
jgi:hypothetical protein